MSEQAQNAVLVEYDDGVRSEDLFRRAAFGWALSTKRLVDSSRSLGKDTKKVAYTALADIEYAKNLLDKLFLPVSVKVPAEYVERISSMTAESVRDSVSGLVARMSEPPPCGHRSGIHDEFCDVVNEPEPKANRSADLSTPVYPKAGKMLWAGVDCPACPSKASQRCQRDDGSFMEKPHAQRKNFVEAA